MCIRQPELFVFVADGRRQDARAADLHVTRTSQKASAGESLAASMELTPEDLPLQPPGGRILYTCVDAAGPFVAFGANTGSVYVFASATRKQLVVFSAAQDLISHVRLSPSAELIAASTGKTVVIFRHNASSVREAPQMLLTVTPSEAAVTALAWDHASARLFTGCEDGLVTVTKASTVRRWLLLAPPPSAPPPLKTNTLTPPHTQRMGFLAIGNASLTLGRGGTGT